MTRMPISPALLLGTLVLFSRCSPPPAVNSGNLGSSQTAGNPPMAAVPAVLPEYRLGFGDVIEVKFFNNERFNESVAVRPDGRITLERVGEVNVSGMTPLQLDSLVTLAYAKILREPEVSIFVREFGSYQVYVLGDVNQPGGYPIQRKMTPLQAVAVAGGGKSTATLSSVMLLRPNAVGEIAAFRINLSQQVRGRQAALQAESEVVMPGDVIYVPKSSIASTSEFLKLVWDGLLPPVDVYLRALWWRRP